MRRYLEKIDGVPLERIPGERARRLLEDQAAPDGFVFPAHGIGQLMDAMAAAARGAGADLRLGTRLAALAAARRPHGRRPGRGARRPGGAGAPARPSWPCRPGRRRASPSPARRPRRPPRCGCGRSASSTSRSRRPSGRLTPEAWIQVDDPRVPFARAFEPVNWSPALAPAGRTVLGLECYCQADDADPVWGLEDAALARACAAGARRPPGLARRPRRGARRSRSCASRAPTRSPTSRRSRPSARRPLWLDGVEGVHLAPGSAVIEAIEAGERAARAVLAGEPGPRVDPAGVPPIS